MSALSYVWPRSISTTEPGKILHGYWCQIWILPTDKCWPTGPTDPWYEISACFPTDSLWKMVKIPPICRQYCGYFHHVPMKSPLNHMKFIEILVHHELPIRNHTMKSPFLFQLGFPIRSGEKTINCCRISHLAAPRPSAAPPSPAAAAALWRCPRTPRPAEARRKWRRAPATPKMSRCSGKDGKKLGFNHPKNGKSSKNGEKIENHPKIMKKWWRMVI